MKPDSNNGYRSPATGFLLACIFAATASAQPSLDALLDGEIGSLVATYKRLHAAPELSHYEENTAAFFAGQLRAMGYTVTERVGKFDRPEWVGYGVVAVMKNGDGPSVLVRTDLDALPIEEKTGLAYASKVKTRNDAGQEVGVMHACGHDIHITTMLGVARIMATLKDQWQGTLVLIGQPAEETIDGARAMLKDGLYARFPRPAYALALHDNPEFATGHVACVPGYALASANSVDIKIRGVGGHGSRPEAAKDPVVLAAEVVMALQTIVSRENSPLDPAVITVGSIHGGTRYNIIPDEVNLQLTVRAFKEEVRQKLLAAIERVTKGLALAAGLPGDRAPIVKVSETEATPATYNDPALTERLAGALVKALGRENVSQGAPIMGSEDFGLFSLEHQIPTTMFWLGASDPVKLQESRNTGRPMPSLHSALFAPVPEPTLRTGVKAMTSAVLELMKK
ncbi:MAG TPA: amidohydrolase [Dongiaceae bacterium]|nr:amidohydrolase [Dongiaceae bacterium]